MGEMRFVDVQLQEIVTDYAVHYGVDLPTNVKVVCFEYKTKGSDEVKHLFFATQDMPEILSALIKAASK